MITNQKILIIQTAFIGDVILATPLIESIRLSHPDAKIDFCLRKGNESLFEHHPLINDLIIWDKGKKYISLLKVMKKIRSKRYDKVICVQRFFNTGLITILSKAKQTIGFNKNPLSVFFHKTVNHEFNDSTHETERNLALIKSFCPITQQQPKLYINFISEKKFPVDVNENFVTISPSSVWFTKQFPEKKWVELLNNIPEKKVYLLGGPDDNELAIKIIKNSSHKNSIALSGKLSLLESAFLMSKAQMNFVNDSAPMHLASATNSPVAAIFCSTIPSFGFGPLSDHSKIIENENELKCRPCGLHGKKTCPEGHFNCAMQIKTSQLTECLNT